MDKIYLDEDGYKQYLEELEAIKKKIEANSRDITEYMSDDAYGDGWHDNFAYEQAMQKENVLKRDLDLKLKGLNNIVIVDSKTKDDIVGLNKIVDVLFDGETEIESFLVTGNSSSNIDNDIPQVTINSPLGSALYKKKKNDIFSYNVDKNIITGKIIDIKKK